MNTEDKERGITIASNENTADAINALTKSGNNNVVVVGTNKETVNINGVEYARTTAEPKAISPNVERSISLAAKTYGRQYERNRPNVDIVEEFKLVQDKKSKLGRSDRDWVENTFHKMFKKV